MPLRANREPPSKRTNGWCPISWLLAYLCLFPKAAASLGDSEGHWFRRIFVGCATAGMVTLVSISGLAATPSHASPSPPVTSYRVTAKNPDRQLVLDIQGAPRTPNAVDPPVYTGTVRLSPHLCEGRYRLRFRFTTNNGDVRGFPYAARMRGGKLDGLAKPCPFDGLPRRRLRSLEAEITIDGQRVLHFTAYPSTRRGNTFSRLRFPRLTRYRAQAPIGRIRVFVRARYASHRSHRVEFSADTK
jgi:hypothetical protein